MFRTHLRLRLSAEEEAREAAVAKSKHAGRNAWRHFRFLIAVAVSYLVGHVLAMPERTQGITFAHS